MKHEAANIVGLTEPSSQTLYGLAWEGRWRQGRSTHTDMYSIPAIAMSPSSYSSSHQPQLVNTINLYPSILPYLKNTIAFNGH